VNRQSPAPTAWGQSQAPAGPVPGGLAVVAIDQVQSCPIQPRVNFSVDLIEQLSSSMRAGRHQPLIEVEPAPGEPGRYQIVCGEQRWRAARAAGMSEILVRLHRPLGYLERLEKQYEENRLRADLDPVEEAACILLDRTIRSVATAERLLRDALVPFQPLDDKRVTRREEFGEHLQELRALLVTHKVHVVRSADGRLLPGPLSPWRETEQALGVSESARKAKVGILRLDPELQEEVRRLPAEHAIQISRLPDRERQAELVARATDLTHDQVHAAVDRLRQDPDLTVSAALAVPEVGEKGGPAGFNDPLADLADLGRQLLRTLANLRARLSVQERRQVSAVLAGIRQAIVAFEEDE
jgi:ParB-like chromosome segregation protein Spo0J